MVKGLARQALYTPTSFQSKWHRTFPSCMQHTYTTPAPLWIQLGGTGHTGNEPCTDISASGEAREERGGDDLIAGTQDVLQHRLSQTRDASNLIAFQAVRLLN